MKKNPPTIQPAPSPGPDYDPMDRIVQDLQNIQSFLSHLEEHLGDMNYLDTHLSQILAARRVISQQLGLLAEAPYSYSSSRLNLLRQENETIFSYIEGAVGAMKVENPKEFKRFIDACGKTISKFDEELTP
jgi:hypothetical protein